jgi:hypothetical protein
MDKRLIGSAMGEGSHHVGVSGIGKFIPFLGEPLDVITEAFPILLCAPLEALGVPRAPIGAQEVSTKAFQRSAQSWMVSAGKCSS